MSGIGVVVGAGVVGLACARVMAARGLDVLVLEAAHMIGTGVSSRNSEVIHAGIYYSKGSLKARTCVAGKKMLYDYCRERAIGHERCGKLIVATSADQLADLERIKGLAAGNGVDDLRVLPEAEARAMEPNLACVGALLSPSTGIVDSHSLMLSLQGDAEVNGACVVFNTPVLSYEVLNGAAVAAAGGGGHLRVHAGGEEPMEVDCDVLVNASGLSAPDLASQSGEAAAPTPNFAKGNYYKLEGGPSPFRTLIYPVPEKNTAGLGVHATLDLNHQIKFGPDVEWLRDVAHAADISSATFEVDPARADSFYEAIRKYWPGLPDESLVPDYSGIRPKISGPGEPAADFCVHGPAQHGVRGLVNLFGIESPGLTASLALAEHVGRELFDDA